jgi:alpha-amylase
LNQSNPSVAQKLTSWVKTTVQKYNIDGLRIDTVPEVDKSFWSAFVASAGIYAVGEVFNGNPQYVGSYQKPNGPIPGVLSYPLFFTLRNVFAKQQSMNQIQSMEKQYKQDMGNLSYIASFVDNHDNPRFLFENPDKTLYKNALLYGLFATGIPIVYYGSEQGFDGGNDPLNREVLWPTKYSESGDLYKFIKTAVGLRKTLQVWEHPQVQRYSTTNFYAFTRGTALVALTNVGSQGQPVTETISYQPYKNGTKLCDQLNTANCVVVQNGKFQVTLTSGMCAVFTPQS